MERDPTGFTKCKGRNADRCGVISKYVRIFVSYSIIALFIFFWFPIYTNHQVIILEDFDDHGHADHVQVLVTDNQSPSDRGDQRRFFVAPDETIWIISRGINVAQLETSSDDSPTVATLIVDIYLRSTNVAPLSLSTKNWRQSVWFPCKHKMMLSVTNLEWSSNLEVLAKERVETKLGMFSELLDYSKKKGWKHSDATSQA